MTFLQKLFGRFTTAGVLASVHNAIAKLEDVAEHHNYIAEAKAAIAAEAQRVQREAEREIAQARSVAAKLKALIS